MYLKLAKIKGHSERCTFALRVGSENQSGSGVTTICLRQCSTSSHRVDRVVDVACGMLVQHSKAAAGRLLSDDHGGEHAGCGGPGLLWLYVICNCEAGWRGWSPLETTFFFFENEHLIYRQQLWWTFLHPARHLHAPSKPKSVASCV